MTEQLHLDGDDVVRLRAYLELANDENARDYREVASALWGIARLIEARLLESGAAPVCTDSVTNEGTGPMT